MRKSLFCTLLSVLLLLVSCETKQTVYYAGDSQSDLIQLLEKEGYRMVQCPSFGEAIEQAPESSGILYLNDSYPMEGSVVTTENLEQIKKKSLRVMVDFPKQIGSSCVVEKDTLELERIVAYKDLAKDLPALSLMTFNRCIFNKLEENRGDTLLVAAKVAGFDDAYYGLENTPVFPMLYLKDDQLMVSSTSIANFASTRYMPEFRVKSLFEYMLKWLLRDETFTLSSWPVLVSPMYGEKEVLPQDAGKNSILKGVEWYYNGHFLVHESWGPEYLGKYMGDGSMPIGPELPRDAQDGDGSLGVLEGHMSGIYHDGKQLYRYWLRDDVQGEAAFAFASAGSLFNNEKYLQVSRNLLDYSFREYRDSVRNNPESPSYGLLGWAYTHKGTYFGDDNARSILATMAAAAIMKDSSWNQKIVECIVGNFRTTGVNGFRGHSLLDEDIQKKGWKAFYQSDLVDLQPHFESWNWACFLWLYNQTQYKPLLERVKKGVGMMMEAYPDGWNWTNGIQQERARMLLPLAWLYRVEPTEQHLKWLDLMVKEVLKNQAACGGIREELGDSSKGLFGRTPSNAEYGKSEAPLIFENGDPVVDMLYTTNFAFVGLNEAARATKDPSYLKALEQMRDFFIRIQVKSDQFKNVDGAWFRAFNYQHWNYWASNADAGWGVWSTLTGWIQSWIVGTQYMMEKNTSLWDLYEGKEVSDMGNKVIDEMITSRLK